jgi:hypothetical protein
MPKLADVARLIRSKNAGPFTLVIDVMFDNEKTYLEVCDAGILSAARIASIYRLDAADVRVMPYLPALAIKISLPRPHISGELGDTDIFGGQQYAPVADLEYEV